MSKIEKKLHLSGSDYTKIAIIFGVIIATTLILQLTLDKSFYKWARRKDAAYKPKGKAPRSGEELLLVSGRA